MMWVFVILLVLVLGGVAVVAAGRGEPEEPVFDDRPDVFVPADRLLGSDDLRRVKFSLAVRGYRMSEVDALLDRLAEQLTDFAGPEPARPQALPAAEADEPEADEPAEGIEPEGQPDTDEPTDA